MFKIENFKSFAIFPLLLNWIENHYTNFLYNGGLSNIFGLVLK